MCVGLWVWWGQGRFYFSKREGGGLASNKNRQGASEIIPPRPCELRGHCNGCSGRLLCGEALSHKLFPPSAEASVSQGSPSVVGNGGKRDVKT